jgi:hypothetical protein
MKTIVLIILFQIFFCHSLWAQEDSTAVANDTTGLVVTDDRADTLTTSIDSLEVEDIHPQDSPEERGF